MEFEVGKRYVTRDLRVVTFLGDRRELAPKFDQLANAYPLVFMGTSGTVHMMTAIGRYLIHADSGLDIVGEAPKVEKIVRYVKRSILDGELFLSSDGNGSAPLGKVTIEVTKGVLTGARVDPCTPAS